MQEPVVRDDPTHARCASHPGRAAARPSRPRRHFVDAHVRVLGRGGSGRRRSCRGGRPTRRPCAPPDHRPAAVALAVAYRACNARVRSRSPSTPGGRPRGARVRGVRRGSLGDHRAPDLLEGLALERVWGVDAAPENPAALPDQAALRADGDADIIPTSGTTGTPKGVVTSHAEVAVSMGDAMGTSPVRTILHAVPLTGYGGLTGSCSTRCAPARPSSPSRSSRSRASCSSPPTGASTPCRVCRPCSGSCSTARTLRHTTCPASAGSSRGRHRSRRTRCDARRGVAGRAHRQPLRLDRGRDHRRDPALAERLAAQAGIGRQAAAGDAGRGPLARWGPARGRRGR